MPEYHFYLLDKDEATTSGSPYVAQCEDDDAALMYALQSNGENTVEIWTDNRRLAVIHADD